jgi:hypothetical protein
LASGPLVENIGYVATAWVYSALGLILTLAIALYWRNALWDKHSVANNAL